MKKSTNVEIEFRPKWVRYECPLCGYEHEEDYDMFQLRDIVWEDWKTVHCSNCHKDFDIDDIKTC